jgi:hypothetical protein
MASAEKIGNPTTTQSETSQSRFSSRRLGQRCPVKISINAAAIAATTARPGPINSGSR